MLLRRQMRTVCGGDACYADTIPCSHRWPIVCGQHMSSNKLKLHYPALFKLKLHCPTLFKLKPHCQPYFELLSESAKSTFDMQL